MPPSIHEPSYVADRGRLPVIRLHRFNHRGEAQIGLRFPFDAAVKGHLLRLSVVRWSRTHGCFYIRDDEQLVEQLVEHSRGKIWLRLADLRVRQGVGREDKWMRGGSGHEEKNSRVELEPAVRDKIELFVAWLRQKRYQPSTQRTYLSFVRHFFAHHPEVGWDGITLEMIHSYNDQHFIGLGRSYSSQNQFINAIKLYLKVHRLDVGTLTDIERPRRASYLPDVLTPAEIAKVLRATANMKHRTLLMLIYSCGLRIGEALALRVSDIQSAEGLIYIRGGKGKKDRRVPLSSVILVQLRRYYKTYKPKIYLFEGQRGGKYSSASAAKVLKRAVKKAGIVKRVTLHTLRHSYATHITQRGVGLRYVQEILGHRSPKTTMIYTHLGGNDIKTVRSPLDDLDL